MFFLLIVATIAVWRGYFTQPAPTERPLFSGISYRRQIKTSPRPVTIHLLIVKTQTPGLRFFVTPPDISGAEKPLFARTTTEFLRERNVQVAINADFFYPWWTKGPFNYYPHRRDQVTVEGDAVSEGIRYAARDRKSLQTLYLSQDNRPSLVPPKDGKIWNAVGGHALLRDGKLQAHTSYDKTVPDPRTAVGWSPDGDTIYLVCVDGRQAGYSAGMTVQELAAFFKSLGVRDAINLDGGGSTALAISDGAGGARLLNRPIDQRFPGKERYIANHLGIYAPPLPP